MIDDQICLDHWNDIIVSIFVRTFVFILKKTVTNDLYTWIVCKNSLHIRLIRSFILLCVFILDITALAALNFEPDFLSFKILLAS